MKFLTATLLVALFCLQASCSLIEIIAHGGERTLQPAPPPAERGPHVILFALDGAGYNQLTAAIRSGKAPHIEALLGKEKGGGLFEHAYSVPDVVTIMPSSTIAGWSSIITGRPPAEDGVPGDEFFVREQNRFYTPIPISSRSTEDFSRMIDGDLLGKILKTPTLYEQLKLPSDVSLLFVYHGATLYTTISPGAFVDLISKFIEGKLSGKSVRQSVAGPLDLDSVSKALDAINEHGIPNLLVVYFPGIDIFTHGSPDPLVAQVEYLETYTDQGVGEVLDAFARKGVLDKTYVIFTADHGHTPVPYDDRHRIGADGDDTPFALLRKVGFRVREPGVTPRRNEPDYQAVVAYGGFTSYIYLADRSRCPNQGDRCDWGRSPRFKEDVMPALRALHEANRTGNPVARLKETIDLIFARDPAAQPGKNAPPFQIFDGKRLLPIPDYLASHPRPDLIELDKRMRWLGAGPYGDRAGDIVLTAHASMLLPIEDRYYFSVAKHYSWHGSPTLQDSHTPLILAEQGDSGKRLRAIVEQVTGDSPSALGVAPLVRALLAR